MDQNNNSLYHTEDDSSSSPTPRHHFPQHQRLLVQQQQHQLYNLNTELPYPARDSLYYNQQPRSPTLSSPPTSASAIGIPPGWPSHSQQQRSQHRTSSLREEGYPTRHRQRQQQQQQSYQPQDSYQAQPTQLQFQEKVKRESMNYNKDDNHSVGSAASAVASTSAARSSTQRDDPMPSTSDFVKKLYKMLEDPSFQSVVCWGPLGDCFVVKDMNEFTKSILPRMFKHSNFASFVRQLNKYDFHKVKNTDENQFGEHSWTFRHPDFHADRRDALENIKRKVPAQRKTALAAAAAVLAATTTTTAAAAAAATQPTSSGDSLPPSNNSNSNANSSSSLPYASRSQSGGSESQPYPRSSSNPSGGSYPGPATAGGGGIGLGRGGGGGGRSPSPTRAHLTAEIQRLKDEGEDLRGRIRNLERNYESVVVEMMGFQRGMKQQDGLMQGLIGYFLGSESGE